MAWPFTKALKLAEFERMNPSAPLALELEAPWNISNAQLVAWAEFFNGYGDLVSRETAVQVAPVARAVALLVGLADIPLVADRRGVPVDPQPAWLQRTDGPISPWHRMANTIRDLFYDGWAVWLVERGAADQIIRAAHVNKARIQTDGRSLRIDDIPVSRDQIIFFVGPNGGLLNEAAETIKGARAITKNWVGRTQSPIPITVIQETAEAKNLSEAEIHDVVTQWAESRRSSTGATGYVPYGLELQTHVGTDDSAFFTEGRNNVRLDIANFANIPASLLDGSTATASLTYVTAEGQRSSFHEQTVRYWLAPIEHTLSLDNCVPAGQRVRFDVAFLDNVPQEVTDD